MPDIDSLNIKIKADVNTAIQSIDKLDRRISGLSSSMNSLNGSGLQAFSNAMQNFSNLNVNFQNLDNITKALTKLSKINISNINPANFTNAGVAINQFSASISGAPPVDKSIISMTNAIAKLSSTASNIPIVTTNLPALGASMMSLFTTMQNAPMLSQNTITFTNAISSLAGTGQSIGIVTQALPGLSQQLLKFFQTMQNAPTISQNTIAMTQALAGLSRTRVNGSTLNNTFTGVSNSARKSANSVKSLAYYIGKFYATYFLVIRGIKKLWASVESSMNYIEILNYFNAAFEQVASKADLSSFEKMGYESAEDYYNSFSKRAEKITQQMSGYRVSENGMAENMRTKSMGIDPSQVMNYQSMFGQMASSMGVSSENALLMSEVMTKLGADLASVKNMDFNKTWTDMASGLAGMSRTMDKYGVNIRNVNLQQKLNDLGIQANIQNLNQQDKALLRMIVTLESVPYAWADMGDTINQQANQLRLLKSSFFNLGRTIGHIFSPIVESALPYINALTLALQYLAEHIVKILGFQNFERGNIGGGNIDSDILSNLYDESDNLNDSLQDATDSAKELKNELMGFDKINKLSDITDDNSSGKTPTTGLGDTSALDAAFKKASENYLKVWQKSFDKVESKAQKTADKIIQAFKSKDFKGIGSWISRKLTKSLKDIPWKAIYKGAENFGSGLAEFLNGLISPKLFYQVGKTVANSLNTAIRFALKFGRTFDWSNFGKSLASSINGFFKNFDFGKLADSIDAWVQGLAEAVVAFVKELDLKAIFKGIWDFITHLDIGTVAIIISGFTFLKIASILKTAVLTNLIPKITSFFAKTSMLKLGIAITIMTISIEFAKSAFKPIYENNTIEEIKEASRAMFEDWFGDGGISKSLSDTLVVLGTAFTDFGNIIDGFKGMWKDINSGDFQLNIGNFIELPSWNTFKDSVDDLIKDIKSGDFEFETIFGAPLPSWNTFTDALDNLITDIKSGDFEFETIFGKPLPSWNTFTNAFKLLIKDIKNGDFEFTTIFGITFPSVNDVRKSWGKLQKEWKPKLVDFSIKAKETVEQIKKWFDNRAKKWKDKLNKFSINPRETVETIKNWFVMRADKWKDKLVKFAIKAKNSVESVQKWFENRAKKWTDKIVNFAINAVNTIDEVAQWFNDRASKWANKIVDFFINPGTSINLVTQWFNDRAKEWKDKAVSFTINAMTKVEDIKNSFKTAINTVIGWINDYIIDNLNEISITIPEISFTNPITGNKNILLDEKVLGFNIAKIQTFAKGGFPEDGWFRASHGEYFGRFDDGTSYIANNNQITNGIAEAVYPAVYNAVTNAMRDSGNNSNVNINIEPNPHGLFKVVREEANKYTAMTNSPAFNI